MRLPFSSPLNSLPTDPDAPVPPPKRSRGSLAESRPRCRALLLLLFASGCRPNGSDALFGPDNEWLALPPCMAKELRLMLAEGLLTKPAAANLDDLLSLADRTAALARRLKKESSR